MQSRPGLMRWAQLIERECASTGEAPLQVMRAHLATLDQKAGVVAGLSGFLGAVIAFVAPAVLAEPRQDTVVIFLALSTFSTVLAASHAVEALGTAAGRELVDADLETSRIVRLAQRAANHTVSVRYLQAAAAGLGLLSGAYFSDYMPF